MAPVEGVEPSTHGFGDRYVTITLHWQFSRRIQLSKIDEMVFIIDHLNVIININIFMSTTLCSQ